MKLAIRKWPEGIALEFLILFVSIYSSRIWCSIYSSCEEKQS